MRPDIASSLHLLQERLGHDLDGALGAGAVSEFPASPVVREALRLDQIAGAHAGGSFDLDVGSYRFGERRGVAALEDGEPTAPRFGLTVDPLGTVTLLPPAGAGTSGLSVDGVPLIEPTVVRPGQVINARSARFVLESSSTVAPRRGRRETPSRRWRDSEHPLNIAPSTSGGPRVIDSRLGVDHPRFGQVAIAIGDVPGQHPADAAAAVPLGVDLLTQSLAIVGQTAVARAVAMWVGLASSVFSRSDDLGITLHARGHRSEWSWIDALPHLETEPGRSLDLVIIDEHEPTTPLPSRGGLILLNHNQELPVECGVVMDLTTPSPTLTDRASGAVLPGITPIGVSSFFALEVTFDLLERLRRST